MSPFGERTTITGDQPCCYEAGGEVFRSVVLRITMNKYTYDYAIEFRADKKDKKEVECVAVRNFGDPRSTPPCPDREVEAKSSCGNMFKISMQTFNTDIWDPDEYSDFLLNQGDYWDPREYHMDLKFSWRRWHYTYQGESPLDALFGAYGLPGKLCCVCKPKCAKERMRPWRVPLIDSCASLDRLLYFDKRCANMKKEIKAECKIRRGILKGGKAGFDALVAGMVVDRKHYFGHVEGDAWTEFIEDLMPQIKNLLNCCNVNKKTCACETSPEGLDASDFKLPFCVDNMYDSTDAMTAGWIESMKPGNDGNCEA